MTETIELAAYRKVRNRQQDRKLRVFFDQREFRQLLDVYSRRVASGEWRDYAIDQQGGIVIFSIFRHSQDAPLFAIAKRANGRNCEYLVFSGHRKLKHGKTIAEALSVFERPIRLISPQS